MKENDIVEGFQSDFFENIVKGNFINVNDLELALFTVDDEGELTEVPANSQTGYSRKNITFQFSEDSEIYNDTDIEFYARKSWGIVKYLGIYKDSKLIYIIEIPMARFIDKNCTMIVENKSIIFYINNTGVF